MRALLAVLALLVPPVRAADAPPVRLAVIEDESMMTFIRMADPVTRLLREAGPDAALLAQEVVSCELDALGARCLIPPRAGAPALEGTHAIALEDEGELGFVFPADPAFLETLKRIATEPSTYLTPHSPVFNEVDGEVAVTPRPDGPTSVFLRARLRRPVGLRTRRSVGLYYRLRWRGRELGVLAIGRVIGGLGRVAGEAAAWGREGPWTGVARGGVFGSASSDVRGRAMADALERAGLRWSAVGASELEHWEELARYRAERPDGIRFLSANLALAAAPEKRPFPAYELFSASGSRVALIGLTSAKTTFARAALRRHGLQAGDPAGALKTVIQEVRARADVVVALADLAPEELARVSEVLGVDVIVGAGARYVQYTQAPASTHEEHDRAPYANPFPPIRLHRSALDQIEIARAVSYNRVDWTVTHTARLLDDGVPEAEGFPEFGWDRYATGLSSAAPLLPAPAAVMKSEGVLSYRSRQFWHLAAAMYAERAKAEAAILPVHSLNVLGVGDVGEEYVKSWLGPADEPVRLRLAGVQLKALAEEAAEQASREQAGLPIGARPAFVVSGFDEKGRLNGAALEPGAQYLVAASRSIADALTLSDEREPVPGYGSVSDAVLTELRRRAGSPPERYREWIEGRPASRRGLWKLNFRDVGLNLRQTRVVRDDAFDPVPNSRVQGFDELLIGGVFKTDLEYLRDEHKWTNTLEMEYAKSRLTPRSAPPVTNLAANRIMFLTLETLRAGSISWPWLASSWGPSLGLQYDGEFESLPGVRRKQVYSAFPGVELFDGAVVRSLTFSGIVKRDLSRDPPNTQSGLRLRALVSRPVGPAGAQLDAELWHNQFFLTKRDVAGDLRAEGSANVRLRVPIRRHFSVAPFVDAHWFGLKLRPLWGYSLMTGVTVGFSRLWKPQYESF